MQSKQEIELSYKTPDPWGYRTNPEDKKRKQYFLSILRAFSHMDPSCYPYTKAIDICCGEGFITEDLPAASIHGIEISDVASARFHNNIKRVHEPEGIYDLVMATGFCYGHYDWQKITDQIIKSCGHGSVIFISNIESWEHKPAIEKLSKFAKQIFEARFPYNEHFQKVRVFKV